MINNKSKLILYAIKQKLSVDTEFQIVEYEITELIYLPSLSVFLFKICIFIEIYLTYNII